MDLFNAFIVVFASGIRLGTPLILACLAGLWSERSGVVDIGLEGKILVGAFGSAVVATFTGSVWLGLFAGVYLVLSQEAYFQPHMSAGRGFIALAALVFAKWRPWPALATCLLFGFLDAVAIRMQGVELPVIGPVPVQAIEALPYILTVVLLAGFIGKAIPPKASGIPYVKER